jgi:hypothetical protein
MQNQYLVILEDEEIGRGYRSSFWQGRIDVGLDRRGKLTSGTRNSTC